MTCQKCGAIVSFYVGEPEICPECGDLMFEEEMCLICHGKSSTYDHHDPCSNCSGKGYII